MMDANQLKRIVKLQPGEDARLRKRAKDISDRLKKGQDVSKAEIEKLLMDFNDLKDGLLLAANAQPLYRKHMLEQAELIDEATANISKDLIDSSKYIYDEETESYKMTESERLKK